VIRRLRAVLGLCLLGAVPARGAAQELLIDRGVRAAGLWCFPLATDTLHYVYLPSAAQLARDDKGRPLFSFVQYVINEPSAGASTTTITAARGGAILHFLVTYDTPVETVAAAQRVLRDAVSMDARLEGPAVFSDGRYALVSSIITPAGAADRSVLAVGRAPVLEGNRLALSFELSPERATLLMKSFATATPDVSLVFDMTFAGLSRAYDAELTVDWAEVRHSLGLKAGGSVYWVGLDVAAAFDEMRRDNAIRLRSAGSDASMEALLQVVYDKLLTLMFRPVEPEQVPEHERGGLLDALSGMSDPEHLAKMARGTTGFGLYAGFQVKDLKSSGTTVLNFNHQATIERHATIAFNIGDFYARYGADTAYFRRVNLLDATYQQREVHVSVDGALLPEFDRLINSVTVTVRKRHQNGQLTLGELVLDRDRFKGDVAGGFRLVYGWNGDDDRVAWLTYEYRTRWSFKGGGAFQTDWIATDASMIDLFAPYERRTVQVVGDAGTLAQRGVRVVVVQIEYPFFDRTRRQQMVVRPGTGGAGGAASGGGGGVEQQVEITLPRNEFAYDYTITWQLDGGRRVVAQRRDNSGLIFTDDMPPEAPGPVTPAGADTAGTVRPAGET